MSNAKKMLFELQDVMRGENTEDIIYASAMSLLLGSYSNSSENVNLDLILNSNEIKKSVDKAFDIIANEEESLVDTVEHLKYLQLTDEQLSKILVILKSYSYDKEIYKEAFEYMLEQSIELGGKYSGLGTTPSFINKLAVEIVEPKSGEFYDGAFGIGGGAIEAYKYADRYGSELNIYGQELNSRTYAIACIRMFINGIKSADLRIGDTLIDPLFKESENTLKKFDSIIMSPPLGLSWKDKEAEIRNDKYSRFIYGLPGVAAADWLFILSALKSLKEDGKAVIITTLGALFRAGAEETLRKKLIGFDYIESVIELTSGLLNGTAIPCAMIVINMKKSEQMKNKIQFINADDIYIDVRRGKKVLTDENIDTILEIYRNKSVVEGISTIVDINDIDSGNISPTRYVVKTEFNSSDYGRVKINLEKLNAAKKLGDIGHFYRGINVTSKNVQDPNGNYKIINMADIKDGELDIDTLPTYSIENNARVEAYKVEAGDIIISNKGATKVCIIPEHEGDVLISQNFVGIRVKSNYNAEFIKAYLESPIGEYLIDCRKTGSAVSMINLKDLKEIPIVEMSLEAQNKIINEYIEKEKRLKKEMEELQYRLENLKFDLYDKMTIKDTFNII